MASVKECRVELLLGCRVVDADGAVVGRLEEIIAELEDDEYLVREFHVGAFAAFERLGGGKLGRGLLRLLGGKRLYTGYVVPWTIMDLSDPERPRVTVPKRELARMGEAKPRSAGGAAERAAEATERLTRILLIFRWRMERSPPSGDVFRSLPNDQY